MRSNCLYIGALGSKKTMQSNSSGSEQPVCTVD